MSATYEPVVDILENETEMTLVAELPGVEESGLDIQVENRTLTIHGRVNPPKDEREYLLREYGTGDYHRSFELNDSIDAGRIAAEYDQGVLTLHLPKAAQARPRRIPVNPK